MDEWMLVQSSATDPPGFLGPGTSTSHWHLTEKRRWPPLTSRLPALFCQWHIELKFQSCKSKVHNAETANGFSDRSLGGFFDPSIRTWTLLRKFFEATSTDTCWRQVLLRLQISLGRHISCWLVLPLYLCLLDFGLSSVLQKGCLRLHWVLQAFAEVVWV